jgi:hypothetical protein
VDVRRLYGITLCVLLLAGGLSIVSPSAPVLAQREPSSPAPAAVVDPGASRDGQRDFDFEFGTWKARLSRLDRPLTGSTTWLEYEGVSVVRKLWDGRANIGELAVNGPGGRIEGLTLRLYNPQTRQWHISWANARDGMLGEAMTGGFSNGRGEFFGEELLEGRVILVRFVFSEIAERSFRFEQAFSNDWGRTWEVNWKAAFTRSSASQDHDPRAPAYGQIVPK